MHLTSYSLFLSLSIYQDYATSDRWSLYWWWWWRLYTTVQKSNCFKVWSGAKFQRSVITSGWCCWHDQHQWNHHHWHFLLTHEELQSNLSFASLTLVSLASLSTLFRFLLFPQVHRLQSGNQNQKWTFFFHFTGMWGLQWHQHNKLTHFHHLTTFFPVHV